MTNVYDEPVCAIFSVCKVYEKQTVYVSTDVCECFSLSLAVIFKVTWLMYAYFVTIYVYTLMNSCCKCYLVVDGTTLVLTIPLGFSCPNDQWQYYSAGPRFAILLSFPLWGKRSRGLTTTDQCCFVLHILHRPLIGFIAVGLLLEMEMETLFPTRNEISGATCFAHYRKLSQIYY